jgi:ribosomal protein L19
MLLTFVLAGNSHAYAANKPLLGKGVVLTQGEFSIYEGVVSKINTKNRELTLSSPDGQNVFIAPPEMKNFQQVQVGDQVKVSLEIFVTIEKLSKTSAVRSKSLDTSQSSNLESAKPGKTMTRKITIQSQILSKNSEEHYVMIKNTNDEEEKIQVNKASFLRQLNVGDTIKISYQDQIKALISSSNPK